MLTVIITYTQSHLVLSLTTTALDLSCVIDATMTINHHLLYIPEVLDRAKVRLRLQFIQGEVFQLSDGSVGYSMRCLTCHNMKLTCKMQSASLSDSLDATASMRGQCSPACERQENTYTHVRAHTHTHMHAHTVAVLTLLLMTRNSAVELATHVEVLNCLLLIAVS